MHKIEKYSTRNNSRWNANWKMAKSPEKLNHKQTRMGTYVNKLNKIGE